MLNYKDISGWGRYPVQSCNLIRPEKSRDLHAYTDSCIARGQGRSYGDASLNEHQAVILTEKLNYFLEFNPESGILKAESGLTLADILAVIVPAGWFLPVTPGTQFVSLGGCVACDVHGKNHHRDGSFGNHVLNLELILADNTVVSCSHDINPDIFWATVGGMGLTGIIKTVTVRLRKIINNNINIKHLAARNLEELIELINENDSAYSVAWLDASRGRGILMLGEHYDNAGNNINTNSILKNKKLFFNLPVLNNRFNNNIIKLYNNMYYWRKSGHKTFSSDYQAYFYPLDNYQDWNKLYGKPGFVQYQCVLPSHLALAGFTEILTILKKYNYTSFLSILKKMGYGNQGLLSFAQEGFTLALDIPVKYNNKKNNINTILTILDRIVVGHEGRVYLAKDACLSPEYFRKMYPNYQTFLDIKSRLDPHTIFQSSLSRRIGLT